MARGANDSDVEYTQRGGQSLKLDIYLPRTPPQEGRLPVVLAIHGGGWRRYSKGGYGRRVASALVDRGFAVVAPDYVLSTPHRPSWPANFEAVRDAVRWIRSHADRYGFDPDRIAAIGESAGGHLAALLGTYPDNAAPDQPSESGPKDAVSASVQAVVNFYGPVDLERIRVQSAGAYAAARQMLGVGFDRDPERYAEASPLHWASPSSAPTFTIHGTQDRLVPPAQSRSLARALSRARVANRLLMVERAGHGFGFRIGSINLTQQIVSFLHAHLPQPGGSRPVPVV